MMPTPFRSRSCCAVTFLLLVCLATSHPAFAQRGMPPGIKLKPKAGENVEAYFLGDWRPAVVVDVSRNQVLVDLEFAGSTQQRKVALAETRYAWQSDVISPIYVWKDQSGSFSIKAAVVDSDRDARTVTLYRLDTDSKITVPVDKLAEADQQRLKRIIGNAPLKVIPPPPVESFSVAALGERSAWQTSSELASVYADPPKVAMAVPSGGAVFPKLDFWDGLLSLYPIGSSAGWMAAATGSNNSKTKDFPGRLVWATLADGKVRKVQSIPQGELLLAVDAASQRVLTVGKGDDGKNALTLWSASPKTDKAKPIVRWTSDQGGGRGTPFAEFVGGDRVIHRWGDSRYVVWDVTSREAVYEIKQESFFDAPPVTSPGNRYLALPEDKGVRVIATATGDTLATLPVEGDRASGVAFDASGEKLAVLTHHQLAVWHLGSSDPPERYEASSVGSPFGQTLAWVDERSLLVDGKTLFDLDRELPIWSYQPNSRDVVRGSGFREVSKVVSGRLCYGVQLREGDQQAFVIGAVELPGDSVRETVSRVDRDRLWTLTPGTRIRIETDCGTYNSQVSAATEAAIRQAGWVVDSGAEIVMKCNMGRSKQQTVTYEMILSRETRTVTIAPYYSNLQIVEGNTMLWSTGSSSGGAPPFVRLKEGESIQGRINESERPDPEFFRRVKLPGKVLHPRYRGGFGSSVYGKLGLEPKPLADLPVLQAG